MSSGDGFAIKSTIAQIGNVARTQVKAQQPVAPNPQSIQKQDREKRVEKVREAEKAEKQKLKPDDHERGREEERPERDEQEAGEETETGRLLDTKA